MPVSYRFLTRPAGTGAVLLADLPTLPWGLFETTQDAAGSPVSARLAALIESGKRYPPALALARLEVQQVFAEHSPSPAEFAPSYEAALRNLLVRQPEAPYLLAPHLTSGEWYWVLEISGSPPKLSWVSDDFAVQTGKITEFDLTGQQLKRLGYAG
jgi:hypothetical protein